MKFDFSIYATYWPLVWHALLLTVMSSTIAIILSPIIGVGIVLARLARNPLSRYAPLSSLS